MVLTEKQKLWLAGKMDWEGGLYETFVVYSKWKEIKDPEFHRRRQAFEDAAQAFEDYITPEDENGDCDEDYDPDWDGETD